MPLPEMLGPVPTSCTSVKWKRKILGRFCLKVNLNPTHRSTGQGHKLRVLNDLVRFSGGRMFPKVGCSRNGTSATVYRFAEVPAIRFSRGTQPASRMADKQSH